MELDKSGPNCEFYDLTLYNIQIFDDKKLQLIFAPELYDLNNIRDYRAIGRWNLTTLTPFRILRPHIAWNITFQILLFCFEKKSSRTYL